MIDGLSSCFRRPRAGVAVATLTDRSYVFGYNFHFENFRLFCRAKASVKTRGTSLRNHFAMRQSGLKLPLLEVVFIT